MNNAVSVVIPCGEWHGEYIGDAISSCLKADPPPDQIVVVDDFADPPVHLNQSQSVKLYRLEEHRGRSYARNFAVQKATTPWLFFLDADDFLEPTAILDFQTIIATSRADLIYADYDYVDQIGVRTRVAKPKPRFRLSRRPLRPLQFYRNIANIGMFVRRDRFQTIGGFDENMAIAEYWDFFLRYAVNPHVRIIKHSRPFFVARQFSSVLPNAEKLMASTSVRIRNMIKKGYYRKWKNL